MAEQESNDERARILKIYREQPKTQELIDAALERLKNCVHKLTDPEISKKMTDYDRAYCFAAMDWAKFTLDIVGEDPAKAEKMVDDIILGYAQKLGLSTV